MKSFGQFVKRLRTERKLLIRTVAAELDMDPAVLSKIENGRRKAKREMVEKLEEVYGQDPGSLVKLWLSDRIVAEIREEEDPQSILRVAEEALVYQRRTGIGNKISPKPIQELLREYPAVLKAWLFGSFARGDNYPSSDLDIMLEIREESRFSLFDLAEIKERLQQEYNRKIDVVLSRSLKPEFTDRISADKICIYDSRKDQKY